MDHDLTILAPEWRHQLLLGSARNAVKRGTLTGTIRGLEVGDTTGFDRMFDVVERWHPEGGPYAREAGTIGLHESLQNEGLHRATRPSDFER